MILVLLVPLIGALFFGTVRDLDGAPKENLVGFIREYEELKESVLNALNDADEARQRGYNTNPDAMLNLFKEATDLNQRLSKHNDDRCIKRPRSTSDPADLHTIFVLLMASRALRNSIQVELSYQSKAKWPFIRAVRAEYECILGFADDELHPLASS